MIYSEQERRARSAYFYMDPSALVKRYHDEEGPGLVNKLLWSSVQEVEDMRGR